MNISASQSRQGVTPLLSNIFTPLNVASATLRSRIQPGPIFFFPISHLPIFLPSYFPTFHLPTFLPFTFLPSYLPTFLPFTLRRSRIIRWQMTENRKLLGRHPSHTKAWSTLRSDIFTLLNVASATLR